MIQMGKHQNLPSIIQRPSAPSSKAPTDKSAVPAQNPPPQSQQPAIALFTKTNWDNLPITARSEIPGQCGASKRSTKSSSAADSSCTAKRCCSSPEEFKENSLPPSTVSVDDKHSNRVSMYAPDNAVTCRESSVHRPTVPDAVNSGLGSMFAPAEGSDNMMPVQPVHITIHSVPLYQFVPQQLDLGVSSAVGSTVDSETGTVYENILAPRLPDAQVLALYPTDGTGPVSDARSKQVRESSSSDECTSTPSSFRNLPPKNDAQSLQYQCPKCLQRFHRIMAQLEHKCCQARTGWGSLFNRPPLKLFKCLECREEFGDLEAKIRHNCSAKEEAQSEKVDSETKTSSYEGHTGTQAKQKKGSSKILPTRPPKSSDGVKAESNKKRGAPAHVKNGKLKVQAARAAIEVKDGKSCESVYHKPFKCGLCSMRYRAVGHLRNHIKLHCGSEQYKRTQLPYVCRICKLGFRYSKALVNHAAAKCLGKKNSTGVEQITRPSDAKDRESLKKSPSGEVLNAAASKARTIQDKGDSSATRSEVSSSQLQSPDPDPSSPRKNLHKCGFCGITWDSATTLRKHVRSHWNEIFERPKNPLICSRCSEEFDNCVKLFLHVRRNGCTTATEDTSQSDEGEPRNEVRTQAADNDPENSESDTCRSEVKACQIRKQGKYYCRYCGFMCRSSALLNAHLQSSHPILTANYSQTSPDGNGEKYVRPTVLYTPSLKPILPDADLPDTDGDTESSMRTGIYPCRCKDCNLDFASWRHLNDHRLAHHPFSVSHVKRGMNQQWSSDEAPDEALVDVLHNDSIHVCDLCSRIFRHWRSLTLHKKVKHHVNLMYARYSAPSKRPTPSCPIQQMGTFTSDSADVQQALNQDNETCGNSHAVVYRSPEAEATTKESTNRVCRDVTSSPPCSELPQQPLSCVTLQATSQGSQYFDPERVKQSTDESPKASTNVYRDVTSSPPCSELPQQPLSCVTLQATSQGSQYFDPERVEQPTNESPNAFTNVCRGVTNSLPCSELRQQPISCVTLQATSQGSQYFDPERVEQPKDEGLSLGESSNPLCEARLTVEDLKISSVVSLSAGGMMVDDIQWQENKTVDASADSASSEKASEEVPFHEKTTHQDGLIPSLPTGQEQHAMQEDFNLLVGSVVEFPNHQNIFETVSVVEQSSDTTPNALTFSEPGWHGTARKITFSEAKNILRTLVRNPFSECYHCSVCGEWFKSIPRYTSHILAHCDVEKFRCSFCEHTDQNLFPMIKHIIGTHFTPDKPNGLTTNQDWPTLAATEATGNQAILDEPELRGLCDEPGPESNLDHPEPDINFPRSGYDFIFEPSSLESHLSPNAKTGSHECLLCPFQIKAKCELLYHLRIHHNLPPYRCRHCQQKLHFMPDVKVHFLQYHSHAKQRAGCQQAGTTLQRQIPLAARNCSKESNLSLPGFQSFGSAEVVGGHSVAHCHVGSDDSAVVSYENSNEDSGSSTANTSSWTFGDTGSEQGGSAAVLQESQSIDKDVENLPTTVTVKEEVLSDDEAERPICTLVAKAIIPVKCEFPDECDYKVPEWGDRADRVSGGSVEEEILPSSARGFENGAADNATSVALGQVCDVPEEPDSRTVLIEDSGDGDVDDARRDGAIVDSPIVSSNTVTEDSTNSPDQTLDDLFQLASDIGIMVTEPNLLECASASQKISPESVQANGPRTTKGDESSTNLDKTQAAERVLSLETARDSCMLQESAPVGNSENEIREEQSATSYTHTHKQQESLSSPSFKQKRRLELNTERQNALKRLKLEDPQNVGMDDLASDVPVLGGCRESGFVDLTSLEISDGPVSARAQDDEQMANIVSHDIDLGEDKIMSDALKRITKNCFVSRLLESFKADSVEPVVTQNTLELNPVNGPALISRGKRVTTDTQENVDANTDPQKQDDPYSCIQHTVHEDDTSGMPQIFDVAGNGQMPGLPGGNKGIHPLNSPFLDVSCNRATVAEDVGNMGRTINSNVSLEDPVTNPEYSDRRCPTGEPCKPMKEGSSSASGPCGEKRRYPRLQALLDYRMGQWKSQQQRRQVPCPDDHPQTGYVDVQKSRVSLPDSQAAKECQPAQQSVTKLHVNPWVGHDFRQRQLNQYPRPDVVKARSVGQDNRYHSHPYLGSRTNSTAGTSTLLHTYSQTDSHRNPELYHGSHQGSAAYNRQERWQKPHLASHTQLGALRRENEQEPRTPVVNSSMDWQGRGVQPPASQLRHTVPWKQRDNSRGYNHNVADSVDVQFVPPNDDIQRLPARIPVTAHGYQSDTRPSRSANPGVGAYQHRQIVREQHSAPSSSSSPDPGSACRYQRLGQPVSSYAGGYMETRQTYEPRYVASYSPQQQRGYSSQTWYPPSHPEQNASGFLPQIHSVTSMHPHYMNRQHSF